jgi:pimeloyl-ACP methyl ester carboxylesterase
MIAEGSGPPVLLLHGSGPGTTAAAWTPLVAALAPRFTVVAPDLLGFGESPRAEGPLLAAWTEQALALMDSLGHERFAVVGNSAGGAVALSLARARPRAVTKVVAVGSLGFPSPIAPGLEALWAAESARAVAELITYAPPSEEVVAARAAAMTTQPWYRELFPAPRQRWVDALALTREELAAVQAPVLLIHGAQDRIVPLRENFLPLLETLPDVRGYVFGRCGHGSPVEHTAEFNRLVTSFLETAR